MSDKRTVTTLAFWILALLGTFFIGSGTIALIALLIGVIGFAISGMPVWTWMFAGRPKD